MEGLSEKVKLNEIWNEMGMGLHCFGGRVSQVGGGKTKLYNESISLQNGKTGAQSQRRQTEEKPGRQLDKTMVGLSATVKIWLLNTGTYTIGLF